MFFTDGVPATSKIFLLISDYSVYSVFTLPFNVTDLVDVILVPGAVYYVLFHFYKSNDLIERENFIKLITVGFCFGFASLGLGIIGIYFLLVGVAFLFAIVYTASENEFIKFTFLEFLGIFSVVAEVRAISFILLGFVFPFGVFYNFLVAGVVGLITIPLAAIIFLLVFLLFATLLMAIKLSILFAFTKVKLWFVGK